VGKSVGQREGMSGWGKRVKRVVETKKGEEAMGIREEGVGRRGGGKVDESEKTRLRT